MQLLYISIIQLSSYKIFLGHSFLNTLLLSSWLIFKFRGNITILNLYHTIKMLKLSYTLLKNIIGNGTPFWLINFDLTKEEIVKLNAYTTGEFYITRRWIRGILSNFFSITKAYRKYLLKKEYINSNKVKSLYEKWLYTRFSWPRAIFISNAKSASIVSKETASGKIATVTLVDTDVKTHFYNLPIPCNDDSLESIGFMHSIISQFILKVKYKRVLIWYFFHRNVRRFNSLLWWVKSLINSKKKMKYKVNIKNVKYPSIANIFSLRKHNFKFFFGRSFNYKLYKKNVNKDEEEDKVLFDSYYDSNKKFFYNRLKVLNYRVLSYKYKLNFRRYHFSHQIEGVSSFKSFLNNFIKHSGIHSRTKRIRSKKRIRKGRKNVSNTFKIFFHFIFFYYLNRFNIIIDSYNKYGFNLLNIARIYKIRKTRRRKRRHSMLTHRYTYIFRYKSKKIYKKKKKRKHGYIFDSFNYIKKRKNNMSFFFYHWKYFLMFLGMKLRNDLNKNKK